MRDAQRSKVYEAESSVRTMFDRADQNGLREVELLGSTITLPIERKFASLESVQTYVDRVLALNWVRSRWTRAAVAVSVRERSGTTAAHYENHCATIAIPLERHGTWALRELVVLHELAHHLDPLDPELSHEPAHGGSFVDRYISLVTDVIGPEAGFLLRTALLDHGVAIG